MKLQWVLTTLIIIGAPAAFAQQQSPSKPGEPVAVANIQSQNEDDRLLIQKLEQIENDPIAREKAEAEAQVPLNAF